DAFRERARLCNSLLGEVGVVPTQLHVVPQHEGAGAVEFAIETEVPSAVDGGFLPRFVGWLHQPDDPDGASVGVKYGLSVGGVPGANPDAAGRVGGVANDWPEPGWAQRFHASPSFDVIIPAFN